MYKNFSIKNVDDLKMDKCTQEEFLAIDFQINGI